MCLYFLNEYMQYKDFPERLMDIQDSEFVSIFLPWIFKNYIIDRE